MSQVCFIIIVIVYNKSKILGPSRRGVFLDFIVSCSSVSSLYTVSDKTLVVLMGLLMYNKGRGRNLCLQNFLTGMAGSIYLIFLRWDRIVPEFYVLKSDEKTKILQKRLAEVARHV